MHTGKPRAVYISFCNESNRANVRATLPGPANPCYSTPLNCGRMLKSGHDLILFHNCYLKFT